MSLATVAAALAPHRLAITGAFHPGPEDGPEDDDNAADDDAAGTGTLVLASPGPGFWADVTAAPEFADTAPDALDRWSARVLGGVAAGFGGTALFPFGGPPHHPFHAWALRGGQAFAAPVGLLVHARHGLWLSFRGALALPGRLALPAPAANPCDGCASRPCLAACPVAALGAAGYDVAACRAHLAAGPACMTAGCLVRASCPASAGAGRLPAQSAYHMRQFQR